MRVDFIYQTKTGNQYPVEILFTDLQTNKIPHNRNLTLAACQKGCSLYGRNGGCPPYAPDFYNIALRYQTALVILAKLRTEHFPIRVLEGPYYVRWVFVETTINRLLDNLGRRLAKNFSTMFLGSGHCVGCKNKKCAFKQGSQECSNPTERIFSMEATGVLVTELVKRWFGFPLYWWQRNEPSYIPPYMCKVVCLLAKNQSKVNDMQSAVADYLAQH
ncbi:MAG: hypothetical protein JRI34_02220 [Deltaproteobacteria bacterium]|nr:hypothetical protein [Deltaproteobacteria bacterium]